jgi:hypothetical protein
MSMTAPAVLLQNEADWAKIQQRLAVALWKSWVDDNDWHVIHWMEKYRGDFFRFFQQEKKNRPDRLVAWWRSQSRPTAPNREEGPSIPVELWPIARAWHHFTEKQALEVA